MIDTYSFLVGLWSGSVMAWLLACYVFVVRHKSRSEGALVEIKTPFLSWYTKGWKLESSCPQCDALMTVELKDIRDPRGELIQVCKVCGYKQEIEEK